MRILMLASSLPKYPRETTAPFIEEIAAGIVARGHQVTLVAPWHPDLRRQARERGIELRFFRYAPHPALNIWGYAQSLQSDTQVRERAWLAAPFALTASWWALRRELRRAQAVGQPFDLVQAHWVLPNGPPAALAALAAQLPLVVSLHGSDIYLAETQPVMGKFAGLVFRQAAAVTACSADLSMRGVRLGANPARTFVIPYGVDPMQFRPDPASAQRFRDAWHIPADAPIVLGLGRLVAKKGFSVLLDAWPAVLRMHPTARLVIAGYGDLRPALEAQAARLGIAPMVIFTGQLDRAWAAMAMAAADVFALPIVRDGVDGLPNVLLEAMGAARPIVATRVAGVPDVISDGVHGLIVPERDPTALAAAIGRLIADRALAERLGAAARRRIIEELTWANTAARYEAAFVAAVRGRSWA
ncbi:MAG: glycosyl transferase family 1 [Chloroflexus sp.]|uniref:glycosyltransferase n=1 Tax=Chloroflexus sp. TaxID=1904827 RepID=UPI0021DE56EB|nr:glycosyltransferase [Chloroflexus sp.]GIV87974.1 MAG: glycosyl transferase family 1 [Chloroflexus sp.]